MITDYKEVQAASLLAKFQNWNDVQAGELVRVTSNEKDDGKLYFSFSLLTDKDVKDLVPDYRFQVSELLV